MALSVLLLLSAVVAYSIYRTLTRFISNLAAAKRTGLPYYVIPCSPFNWTGQAFRFIYMPLWKLFPRRHWENVQVVLTADWHYRENHRIFEKLGDSFIVISPGQVILYTENAEVIHQITSKREQFPKPTESYKLLSQYGENVVTTEGAEWRMHRKITSASFNEKNAALVFHESINQTQGLVSQWLGPDDKGNKTIKTIEHDTMALMLHIIGYIGFGLKLLWPVEELPPDIDPKLVKYSTLHPPAGHTMNFVDSLAKSLENIIILLIVPRWILNRLPFKKTKEAAEAQNNCMGFMHEFLHDKIDDVNQGNKEVGMDIMGQLVRTSYGEKAKGATLTDSEIIGNAFVMLVAGHETTANIMNFTLLELANNPPVQRALQKDLDNLFGDTDPQKWDYESCINPLMASLVAACMNETLRIVPPVVDIPKRVTPGQDQAIVRDGEKVVIPQDTFIGLTVAAVQRNPRYWPSKPSKITGAENDMDDWVPERWYRTEATASDGDCIEGADTEDFGGFAGPDTSAQLFRPAQGSYIPFSAGARSCLGRRIAQVEMVAALSVIFQKYSLELAVDEWASDDEVKLMSREQKAKVYKKAQGKSREDIKSATSLLTLKMHGSKVIPVRLVKRGEERFVSWLES
ncbi:cytochrome P450 [Pseudomassariella vexata]|uniref:Cytochrome P450 n=1 Tax=Pseudomassariella vexata TaxID=1141098 RepID=A0A1Y2EB34_9PEZI|nr:cytochrome P450 [Pseudomassariella vexata]ORY68771.1 cytochrome P450 [Pseudomassariella vexata]